MPFVVPDNRNPDIIRELSEKKVDGKPSEVNPSSPARIKMLALWKLAGCLNRGQQLGPEFLAQLL